MRNMLEYINTGKTNDSATIALDQEVKEARIREEWRTEYMQTIVHDKDVYRDGYDDGKAEGIAEGIAEGKAEGKIEAIIQVYKNCLSRGMTRVEAIAISGIAEEDIPNS